MGKLIGRRREISILDKLFGSGKSEFVAIYGRRRVGKSYLVNEKYRGKIAFRAIGTYVKDKAGDTYRQLQMEHFYDSLLDCGLPSGTPMPTSWREAFRLLRCVLVSMGDKRKVVFLDELPWLAGPQSSEMIAELGYFWNSWADMEGNVVLVVCGSATSWMLDNVIRDYGGLHGRLTEIIHLEPFSLCECRTYFSKAGFHLSDYEVALAYMVIGGVPFYMARMDSKLNLTENVNKMFFADERIDQEFVDVYAGLYSTSERYISVVKALGEKFYGMTRAELSERTGIAQGGTFSKILANLLASGIIREYPRNGGSRVETVVQLVDFFSLFYLNFAKRRTKTLSGSPSVNWAGLQRSPEFFAWAGHTFELLVFRHIGQLCDKLRIATVSRAYCWRSGGGEERGAQIDLILEWDGERTDYLCEIKFSENVYAIDSAYEGVLLNKLDAFMRSKQHKQSHSVQLAMVTTRGIAESRYASCVNRVVTLDDLFAESYRL